MHKLKYEVRMAHKDGINYALPHSDEENIHDKTYNIHGVSVMRPSPDGEVFTLSFEMFPKGTPVELLENLEHVGRNERRVRISIGDVQAITGDWALES
jgi:hypothetical protein